MPKIIIRDRMDRTGLVKLTLGKDYKELPRNKQILVSDNELFALMNSHEGPHIFVVPGPKDLPDQFSGSPSPGPGDLPVEESSQSLEETHVAVDRTERADADPGRNEKGVGSGRKFR